MTFDQNQPNKARRILIFILTIILGFILFALPNIFFGITKINGGVAGINLAIIAFFQLVTVCTLIYFSLKFLKKDFNYIGLSFEHWKGDFLLGLSVTIVRTAIDFLLIIPNTGGAERADIVETINGLDGTTVGLISIIILGVVGGGITEEIYNRGFFITIMRDFFKNPKAGMWVAVVLSILFFAVGHFPTNTLEWLDILVAGIIYTGLFLLTKRLTASIVAHGLWNMLAILLVNFLY